MLPASRDSGQLRGIDSSGRFGTVDCHWRGTTRVPEMHLAGKWLREAVFDLGKEFEVKVEPRAD